MKNILVTGGAGFIGSNFITYFLKKYGSRFNIINVDKLSYAGDLRNLDEVNEFENYYFIEANVTNRKLVENTFKNFSIDTVIHFAAESHVDNSIDSPEVFVNSNIKGTFVLLDTARKMWDSGEDKLFIQMSTDEVYGSVGETSDCFYENSPYRPSSPYSASKASSDMLVEAYAKTYGLRAIIPRCSNNYGPRQHVEKLIPKIIKNVVERRPIPLYGDGKNIRDWTYVLDSCRAIDLLLHRGRANNTYNIGAASEKSNVDVAETICDIYDEKYSKSTESSRKLITFVDDRPGHDKKYSLNCEKLRREINWYPEKNFEVGILETINWYMRNRYEK
ncbi:MAG: dTDP-glucose 4,6-dehydratase [Rickettsiales bacterium]|jgi:dTDP-glucose 4,6-dehydratase|nr:dTDP-glucose 4,6-dehydratase [Rickettsiales bacterium]